MGNENTTTRKAETMTTAALFAELMDAYDQYRDAWIAKHGDDAGFDAWFTRQTLGDRLPINLLD
jgi:hypothetical protein